MDGQLLCFRKSPHPLWTSRLRLTSPEIWLKFWLSSPETSDLAAPNLGLTLNLFLLGESVTKLVWSALGKVTKFLTASLLSLFILSSWGIIAIFCLSSASHEEAITFAADLPSHWMFCFVGLVLSYSSESSQNCQKVLLLWVQPTQGVLSQK